MEEEADKLHKSSTTSNNNNNIIIIIIIIITPETQTTSVCPIPTFVCSEAEDSTDTHVEHHAEGLAEQLPHIPPKVPSFVSGVVVAVASLVGNLFLAHLILGVAHIPSFCFLSVFHLGGQQQQQQRTGRIGLGCR